MNGQEIKILNECRVEICERLSLTEVLAHLQAKSVLAPVLVQQIKAKPTQFERNDHFLDILTNQGQHNPFDMFIQALQESNQQYLGEIISKKANVVTQGQNGFIIRFKTINPFSSSFTYNIENTWVSLALKENAKHAKGTEDHAELLKQAFRKEKMLIVEGNPGTGKTSLMRRLAYEWARGKGLKHYDLIIYAEFRELRNQKFKHITELVASYLKSYVDEETFMELQKIVANKKWLEDKHVLVLLDGFDESSSEEQCVELYSYLYDTVTKSPLFNIIMTTRPGRLLAEHKGSIMGRFVFAEVLGFITDEQKRKYISNHFSNHVTEVEAESICLLLKSKEIKELTTVQQKDLFILQNLGQTEADALKREALSVYFMLKSNKSLSELAETPLFLTFICLVNGEKIDDKNPLLDLYCKIIRWLLDRYQKTCKTIDVPNLFGHYTSDSYVLRRRTIHNHYLQFPQLRNLGNMALHNLERNSFLQSDLDSFDIHPIVEQVGLLRKEEKFDTYGHITIEFSFMHRTIQEFLAAFSYFNYQMTSNEVKKFMERDIFHKKILPWENRVVTEYEKFLWRIATSNKFLVSPEMQPNFFKSYSTLVLHSDIFSSSAEICLQQSKIYLEKCSNITKLYLQFNGCSFQENSQLHCTNLPVLKEMDFWGCSFQENSQLNCTNLPVLEYMYCSGCSFQENSKLNCTNLPVLKGMDFDGCSLQENSQLNCTNLPVLARMYFWGCSFQENSQLNCTNLPVLERMNFWGCSFQENSQLNCTNLPVLKTMNFWGCSFQENSQLNCTNLPVLERMYFDGCSFQENSQLSSIKVEGWKVFPVARFRPEDFDPNEPVKFLFPKMLMKLSERK